MEEFVEIFHKDIDSFRCTSRFVAVGTTFEAVLFNLGVKIPEHLDEQTVTKISHRLGFATTQGSWEEFTDWVERKGHWTILGSLSMTGKPQVVVTLGYNTAKVLEDFGLLTSTATAYVAPDRVKVQIEEPKMLYRDFTKL